LNRLCQIAQDVKSVGNLQRFWCAFAGSIRICASPVSADHFNAGMRFQPMHQRL
jgi:hypothetical protein